MSDTAGRMVKAFLACGIDRVVVVAASGLDEVFSYFDRQQRCIWATREEEALAVASGLALGGERPLVIMQQSGVGNALNAAFSLSDAYGIYFPILVCDRGAGDDNPVQRVSSEWTGKVLQAIGGRTIDFNDEHVAEELGRCLRQQCRWITSTL